MRWCRSILAACTALAIAPTAAAAQVVLIGSGGSPTTRTSIPVSVTGMLSVRFHGDPAAGCARWGLCGYSGTVSWQPPVSESLTTNRTEGRHPKVTLVLFPALTLGSTFPGGVTTASVALAGGPSSPPGAHCVDAVGVGGAGVLRVRGGRATVSLAGESSALLATRCAGPRDADVLPHLHTPTVSVRALERGHTTISLAASHALSAHGFSGSITSTIVLHLGSPGRSRAETGSGSQGPTKPGREIDVAYRATLRGSVVEEIRGAADPLECSPLGSCGLAGTVTVTAHVRTTQAHLIVSANAATPHRELLAAAGLGPGSPGGVTGIGGVGWNGGGGSVTDLIQGAEHCHDSAALGPGGLLLVTARGRWGVSMDPGELGRSPATGSRCPGPMPSTGVIARAGPPLSSLDRRTARISLTAGSTVKDDGYQIRFVPHLTLTLTRVRVRTKAIRIASGGFVGS